MAHEFGALGLLCATPTHSVAFPGVGDDNIVPHVTVRDKGERHPQTDLFKDPSGTDSLRSWLRRAERLL